MDCQKKSEQMRERIHDFALGEVSPKSELELLAHVAECEACREAYGQAEAVRSLTDRGVETLVAGEPSPQFMTRLRARIAAEPASERWSWYAWRIWEQVSREPRSYAAGAVVLATILAVLVLGLPRRHVSAPTVTEIASAVSVPPGVATNSPKSLAIPERPREKLASRYVPSPRIQREPEVLVPKGELLAVVRFYEAVHSTPVESEQVYAAQEEPQKPVELKPIEITPLEPLAKPVPNSDNGPGLF
ncbi:MAG TPA: zf-HC2 domain-containing protein [Candidatus Acidoferrales bacterium]|nr:zf-HC2 domain-containing protein [Candidatus Acidoferrales bacterium]